MKRLAIRPGQQIDYRWNIMPQDSPTKSDARCLTRFYYSSLKPSRDLASGLIGPLLICSRETMDQRGNQVGSSWHLQRRLWHILVTWWVKCTYLNLGAFPTSKESPLEAGNLSSLSHPLCFSIHLAFKKSVFQNFAPGELLLMKAL